MQIRVHAPLRPTEDAARVQEAATRFFPEARIDATPEAVTVHATRLDELRKRIWELRIIDTFRGQFLHWMSEDKRSTKLRLSKQAALVGKLSFSPRPHALGDLDITIDMEDGDPWPDIEALAWWLCPETKDGEIVGLKE